VKCRVVVPKFIHKSRKEQVLFQHTLQELVKKGCKHNCSVAFYRVLVFAKEESDGNIGMILIGPPNALDHDRAIHRTRH
jgi:hypothetical protein